MRIPILLPICCILLALGSPALAVDARYCESQGAHLTGTEHAAFMKSCLALANISTPAYVEEQKRQNKKFYCETNAKNKALLGSEKASYIAACMEKNEAAEAFAAPRAKRPFFGADSSGTTSDKAPALSQTSAANPAADNAATPQETPAANITGDTKANPAKTSSANSPATTTALPETSASLNEAINRSCEQEFKQKNLKSNVRKQFMATCEEEIDLARYKVAGDELKNGRRNDALWYKVFAENNGDERAAEAAYIRLRVNQLRRCCISAK